MTFEHKPHARTLAILEHRVHPTKTREQLPHGNLYSRVNSWLAVKITLGVGSMTCAWLFCILALLGLPAALAKGGEGPVAWIAQTFLQLVLLSIIIVGTNIQSAAADKRAQDTYADAEAVLHEAHADPGPPGGAGQGAHRPGAEAGSRSERDSRPAGCKRRGPRSCVSTGRQAHPPEAVIMEEQPRTEGWQLHMGAYGFDGIMGRAMASRAPGS